AGVAGVFGGGGGGRGRVRGALAPAGLAPPAGVHLRLHHHRPAPEPRRDRAGLVGRRRDLAGRHRNAVPPQDVAGLVFVEIHTQSLVRVVPASPCNAARPWASSAIMARCSSPRPAPPVRTKSAAASTFGRMLPRPSSFPASSCS